MKTNNKLRKALETLVDVVDTWKDHLPPVIRDGELAKAIKKAEAALAEPVKNNEVGTSEEQWTRYSDFTNKYTPCAYKGSARCTEDCPVNKKLTQDGHGTLLCPFEWAQLPYKE